MDFQYCIRVQMVSLYSNKWRPESKVLKDTKVYEDSKA